jgi:HSP20 family protein
MAETKTNQSQQSDRSGQSMMSRDRDRGEIQRWSPRAAEFGDPIDLFNRMSEEMDRAFDRMWRDFDVSPRRSWLPRGLLGGRQQSLPQAWTPRIEAFQKDDRFIVRAELPGLKKDDVHVELTEDALSIRGERRNEQREEREGYFHSELSYGEFYRTIPLPQGAIGESAEATFNNGVLEVTVQAPPAEANRGRKVEIKDASQNQDRK